MLLIAQSIQSYFSWKIVQTLDPTKLILQNQAWQIDPVRLILWNPSWQVDPAISCQVFVTQFRSYKKSNISIHVAIYNFCGLCLSNHLNQKWSRNFNNHRNACECLVSHRITLFTKVFLKYSRHRWTQKTQLLTTKWSFTFSSSWIWVHETQEKRYNQQMQQSLEKAQSRTAQWN